MLPSPAVPRPRPAVYHRGMAWHRLRTHPFVAGAIAFALRGYLAVRTVGWFVTRPKTRGVRAIACTPEGRVVLVRHSYLRGWHLPGGGQARGESAEQAALRELREEIGLVAHGPVRALGALTSRPNFRLDVVTLLLVEQVAFAFRPSLEIVEAAAFDPRALPVGVTPGTARRVAEWLDGISPPATW